MKNIHKFSLLFMFILFCSVFGWKQNKVIAEEVGTQVIIRKYAEGDYSKLLEGATLKLTQTAGGGFQEKTFVSNTTGEQVNLPDGTYVLTEVSPPQGYGIAEPITFKVQSGKVQVQKNGQFVDNPYKENGTPFSAIAYNDYDFVENLDTKNYAKFYYAKNSDGTNQVVYCFNADLHSPPDSYDGGENIDPDVTTSAEVKFTHIKGNDLLKYAVSPRTNDSNVFLTWIKKVINRGYKGTNDNLPQGLTETQFRAATQLAIYHFTDSADVDKWKSEDTHGFGDMNDATLKVTKDLIEYAQNGEGADGLPDLDFFVPSNNGYQSLIGTQYHPDALVDVIRMEDKKGVVVPTTHKLQISKKVTGTASDKSKDFYFVVELKDANGQPLAGEYQVKITGSEENAELTLKNGRISFPLKDNDTAEILNIPTNYTYTIKESAYDDYKTTISVDSEQLVGTKEITRNAVSTDVAVMFENNKEIVVPTGISDNTNIYQMMFSLAMVAIVSTIFVSFKRK
ncbi:TPA: TQXA domain-containing protein [Streptococcus suis]|nr:TQXA domain-containing protein [Streptococcus suis]HEM4280613.1 TQXA domain-containing protein [Streptococcus suis]